MDARCAPGGVLGYHSEDQITNFFGNALSTEDPGHPGDGSPIQCKSGAMPADHRLRAHNDEGLLPSCPESARENPEGFVEQAKVRPRVKPFQNSELLTQHEVFEQEVRTTSEDSKTGAEEEPGEV